MSRLYREWSGQRYRDQPAARVAVEAIGPLLEAGKLAEGVRGELRGGTGPTIGRSGVPTYGTEAGESG